MILSSFVTQSAINEARSDSLKIGIENQAGVLKMRVIQQEDDMGYTNKRKGKPDGLAASKIAVSKHDVRLALLDELH